MQILEMREERLGRRKGKKKMPVREKDDDDSD